MPRGVPGSGKKTKKGKKSKKVKSSAGINTVTGEDNAAKVDGRKGKRKKRKSSGVSAISRDMAARLGELAVDKAKEVLSALVSLYAD